MKRQTQHNIPITTVVAMVVVVVVVVVVVDVVVVDEGSVSTVTISGSHSFQTATKNHNFIREVSTLFFGAITTFR